MSGFGGGGFAGGLSSGLQNGMSLVRQYEGMKRQQEMDSRERERFEWEKRQEQERQAILEEQRRLSDEVQNGAINTGATGAKVGMTADQVAGLSRGPGGAFDPNAGPYVPAERTPMKRSEVQGRLGALALRKGDVQGYNAAAAAKDGYETDELVATAISAADTPEFRQRMAGRYNASNIPVMIGETDKKGFTKVMVHKPGEGGAAKSFDLSPDDFRNLSVAEALRSAGKGTQALEYFNKVDKNFRETLGLWNDATSKAAVVNNSATAASRADDRGMESLANDRARLGLERQRLSISARESNARINSMKQGDDVMLMDDKGNRVPYTRSFNAATGTYDFKPVPIPQGMRYAPPQKPADPVAYSNFVKNLVESGMPLPDARMAADQQFGTGAPEADLVRSLQQLNGAAAPAPAAPKRTALSQQPPALSREQLHQQLLEAEAAQRRRQMIHSGGGGMQPMTQDDLSVLQYLSR